MHVPLKKKHKFGANRTQARDGTWCASKKEAKRYDELKLLERAKLITDLQWQVPLPIFINDEKVFTYVADAVYWDVKSKDPLKMTWAIEDIKGFKTPEYKLKKKCVEAYYKIKITET